MDMYTKMAIFWGAALILLVVIEAATVQFLTLWFAAGALCALVASLLHAPIWTQFVIFILVSVLSLILTRPLIKKINAKSIVATNADRCIGQEAIVLEDINNTAGSGLVKVNGIVWTARSDKNENILRDDVVTILKIDGAKLLVTKK